jgi:A/G-specific adenine glycosylase
MEDSSLSRALLAWYDTDRRILPWRSPPGIAANPYHVWLSEIMLQQTTVAAVIPYFHKFLTLWPTVKYLAAADTDAVMAAWAGLGYYARARNLHKCAQSIAESHQGVFPDNEESLRKLPGVGAYTAAAIAAIAFGRHAVVVDGNVERVMARLFAVTDPLPGSKTVLKEHAASLAPQQRCGDYSQALMDLGATLCSPRNPACGLCPWMKGCQGRIQGIAASLPAKVKKGEKPTRYGTAFWIARWDGSILLRKRPPSGLLGGMMEIPSTPWRESADGGAWTDADAAKHAPLPCNWQPLSGVVRHTFTHFHLELTVVRGLARGGQPTASKWVSPDQLGPEALPSVMRKIVKHAITHPT